MLSKKISAIKRLLRFKSEIFYDPGAWARFFDGWLT